MWTCLIDYEKSGEAFSKRRRLKINIIVYNSVKFVKFCPSVYAESV